MKITIFKLLYIVNEMAVFLDIHATLEALGKKFRLSFNPLKT